MLKGEGIIVVRIRLVGYGKFELEEKTTAGTMDENEAVGQCSG